MIASYELAVIGAGPAGMEAAITASQSGVNTVVIDSFLQPGGQYFMQTPKGYKPLGQTETEKTGKELVQHFTDCKLTIFKSTLIWGIFKEENEEDWLVALYGDSDPKFIRSKNIVLATGAYDTPVAFPGWTLPGVITCGAALILLKSHRIAPGTRAIVTGTGPLILSVSAHLLEAGVEVLAICESNHIFVKGIGHAPTMLSHLHRLKEGAKYMNVILRNKAPYKTGWSINYAQGKDHVEKATISKVDKKGKPIAGTQIEHQIDLVVSGYSLTPNTGLARMIGCEMDYQAEKGGWVPTRNEKMQSSIPGIFIVGDGAGIGGAENAGIEGQIAGNEIALKTGHISLQIAQTRYKDLQPGLHNQRRFGKLYGDLFTPQPGLNSLPNDETILCRCEEVSLGEIKKAVNMGARTIGEVKMITRSGMGNCQGRMCEHSIASAIVNALSTELATFNSVGFNSIRPPLHPLPVNFLAEVQKEIDSLE